ncbi:ATP-grasp domain-containing protein [Corynebacterium jeddahense]|uniref:Phosphoribosylglycinamide formyltransferase 2 n=1 Tax=Corynebacterium jeddahense TaxID=1414719 RepID=A0ABY7UPZ7_9CORY|nr:ATP-grasp domain-containing protein [Corynebacterium jeddahense]WCZ39704.1 Phosphoribosylglycinamide formyltransferase 2 [Corynebacterium jeddahense]
MTVPHPAEPRRALILGTSPMAKELEQAYRRLGFDTRTGGARAVDEFRPDIIVTTGGASDTIEDVEAAAARVGATVAPSVDACRHTADRMAVRTQASEKLGLPTLDYQFARTPQEMQDAIERIGYPCVVKSPTSNDGEGFSFVRSDANLADAWRNADRGVGQGAVVERYIDFDFEVTILAARSIDPQTGQLATWFCEPIGTRHRDGKLVEAWQPAPLPEGAMDNARSIAARITGALACCGIFSVEMFVSGDDVYFSQVTPRPSRDGLVTFVTQRINQFDLQARATQRLPIDSTLVSPGAARFVPGVRPSMRELAAAMAVEETTVRVLGDGALVLATADSAAEARQRTDQAVRAMRDVAREK